MKLLISFVIFATVAIPALTAHSESTAFASTDNKRYIQFGGKPVVLVGDTAWNIHQRFTQSQIDAYLDNCLDSGINTVAVFAVAIWDLDNSHSWNRRNRFGERPFLNNDPGQLNPAFWNRLKYVVNAAKSRGMYVMICAGQFIREEPSHGMKFIVCDTPIKAYKHGHALGVFFRNANRNVIWCPAQDSTPDQPSNAPLRLVDALAEGITDGVNNIDDHNGLADWSSTFMTWHGGNIDALNSGTVTWYDVVKNKPWNDLYGWESYHWYWRIVPQHTYWWNSSPKMPIFVDEPAYEGAYSKLLGERATAWYARFQAYWSFFSGGSGYIYGNNELSDLKNYSIGIKREGRLDMKWVRNLFESQNIASRIPDNSLIISNRNVPGKDKNYICATRDIDATYAFVYTTKGLGFTLDLAKLTGINTIVRARWFDPRTGNYSSAGEHAKTIKRFTPPISGIGWDWVLVLDQGTPPTLQKTSLLPTPLKTEPISKYSEGS
jgi:hypothetical protein